MVPEAWQKHDTMKDEGFLRVFLLLDGTLG